MRVQRRLSVALMGCLTITAMTMAGRPVIAAAEPAPTTSSGDVAADPGLHDPQLVSELRDTLAQLRPLDPGETALMQDRAVRDAQAGTMPWHSAEMPAWDRAAAFGLPDGRTLVTVPPATAAGNSLGVLYGADGTVSRHAETRLVIRPDESAAATAWIDDAAPMEQAFTPGQLRNAAASAKEVGLASCPEVAAMFFAIDFVAALALIGLFTPAVFIEIFAAPIVAMLFGAALISPLAVVGWCIGGWF